MEVDQFGYLVLADIIASSVGQRGDGLSHWFHLGENAGRESDLMSETAKHFEVFFISHLHTLPDSTFRPSPRFLECSCSSWSLLDMLLWAG